jgi:SAM-dependent methyltransferase
MVKWCTENLSPIDSNFTFEHHDVFNAGLNPHGRSADAVLPLPQESATASLVLACSVFTHLLQRDIPLYLAEMRRIMRPDGVLIASWFLFEKAEFPMMQDFQDCLYINDVDPTNAVMVDKQWLAKTAAAAGLVMSRTVPPSLRGFQWEIEFRPAVDDQQHVSFPSDSAEYGRMPPPVPSTPAFLIGL